MPLRLLAPPRSLLPLPGPRVSRRRGPRLARAGPQYLRTVYHTVPAPSGGGWMGRAGFLPSSALLRAVILNGAVPLAGRRGSGGEALQPPPNHVVGYGRIDLAAALALPDPAAAAAAADGLVLEVLDGQAQPGPAGGGAAGGGASTTGPARVGPGEVRRHCVSVLGSGRALRATLAWTDPAAEPMAGAALVNDLDLVGVRWGPVVGAGPGGGLLHGNHVLADGHCVDGDCNVPDSLNNNEQAGPPREAAAVT